MAQLRVPTALLLAAVGPVLSWGAEVPSLRPYSIEDHFAEQHFVSVEVAPTGKLVAVQLERPASLGEYYAADATFFGETYSRRSDIAVLDSLSGTIFWKSDGRDARKTYLSPAWSPNGLELAFVESGPDGRMTLLVLNVSQKSLMRIDSIDVDPTVLFTGGLPASESRNSIFVWGGNDRLFVAGRGTLPAQPLGETRVEETVAKLRATWSGRTSSRVWKSEAPVQCDAGIRLFEIAVGTKEVTQIYQGDVVGVSVAPEGSRVAVVAARDSLLRPTAAPLNAPQEARFGNRNDLLRWRVDVVERSTLRVKTVEYGEGAVAAGVLPRWSTDARRLAVIRGNTIQGVRSPSVTLFDLSLGTSDKIGAASVADARALATLYAAVGDHAADKIQRGQPISWLAGKVSGKHADVYGIGNAGAAISSRAGVRVIQRGSGREFFLPKMRVLRVSGADRLYLKTPQGIANFDSSKPEVPQASVAVVPTSARFAGEAESGDLIFFGDTKQGSFIWRTIADGGRVVLSHMNEFVSSIIIPEMRHVRYKAGNQDRDGILLLPTVKKYGDRAPVIVTAYPTTEPIADLSEYFSKPWGAVAWRWHPLLAAGFAVFFVDLRRAPIVDPESKSYVETPDLVLRQSLPAVAALAHQRGIDSTRLGFAGYSYGGYTALTLLARTHIFQTISAEVPLANLTLNLSAVPEAHLLDCAPTFGVSGLQELEEEDGFLRVGGPIYEKYVRVINDSPLLNMQSAKTPTLLFSAEFDVYGPNAEEVYMLLMRKRIPVQLVTYWGENHNIRSPGNVRDLIARQVLWFDKYLGH